MLLNNSNTNANQLFDFNMSECLRYTQTYTAHSRQYQARQQLLVLAYPNLEYRGSSAFCTAFSLFKDIALIDSTIKVADSIGLEAISRPRQAAEVKLTFSCRKLAAKNCAIFITPTVALQLHNKIASYIVTTTTSQYVVGQIKSEFVSLAFHRVAVRATLELGLMGLKTYNGKRFKACRASKEVELQKLLGNDPSMGYLIFS